MPTPHRRGSTWGFVINLDRDASGKRRQKRYSGYPTRKAAQEALNRILRERDTGTYQEPTKQTVEQFLLAWLRDYARTALSGRTYQGYESIVRLHLAPALGHHQLSRLSPLHIQQYYTRAQESGRADGRGGLSSTTVLQHHRILREALQHAVRWRLLQFNPADAVDAPRPRRPTFHALDPDAMLRLLRRAQDTEFALPILLAVLTGMRRGEVLALRWDDIDLERHALVVRRSLEVTKAAGLTFKTPKSGKARAVTLPPTLSRDLQRHKGAQAQTRLLVGPTYVDQGLVFADDTGAPLHPERFTKRFGDWVRRNPDLPRLRFQDLRHTQASLLGLLGVHPKVISERLGHSTIGITMDLYSHLLPGMQENAAALLEGLLQGGEKGVSEGGF